MNIISILAHKVSQMEPGQQMNVCRWSLERDTCKWLPDAASAADRVLEEIIGSAYEFGYFEKAYPQDIIVFYRLKEPLSCDSGLRTYVSPDRRQFFDKQGRFWKRNQLAA